MTTIVGSLLISLGLDKAALSSGLIGAQNDLAKSSKQFSKIGNQMTSTFTSMKGALAGLAGAFSLSALTGLAKDGLEYASALGEVSQQLGVTTKDLQEYRYVASQVGISQEKMDAGLAKLTKSIGESLGGSKKMTAAFEQLGVQLTDADGKTRSTGDVLRSLVGAFSAIPDPAKRAALETTLFGKAGQQLDTLLAGGVGQVDNLRNAAQRLGLVLSDKQIQDADDAADKLEAVRQVLSAKIAGVVSDNAKSIVSLADAFTKLLDHDFKDLRQILNFLNAKPGEQMRQFGNFMVDSVVPSPLSRRYPGLHEVFGDGTKDLRGINKPSGSNVTNSDWDKALRKGVGGALGGGGMLSLSGIDFVEIARQVTTMTASVGTDFEGMEHSISASQARLKAILPQTSKETLSEVRDIYEAYTRDISDMMAKAFGQGSLVPDDISPDVKSPLENLAEFDRNFMAWRETLQDSLINPSKDAAKAISETFADMANNVLGAFDQLAQGLKGGGFLDILSGVVGVFEVLSGTGLFGKKLQAAFPSPGFPVHKALGGPVLPNHTYMVGENGPEYLHTGSTRGRISPNDAIGPARVMVVPSPFFEVVVDQRAAAVAAPMVTAGAAATAGAVSRSARRTRSRSIYG